MKIVIDMEEEKYEWIKENNPQANPKSIVGSVAYGTPIGEYRDRLKEVFREASEVGGDLFHLSQIERIIDGEDWL